MVVVPDRQLSLAIGKEGQNTRLAARLTGWRLDIKGMTEWEEIREARRRQVAAKAASKTELEESEEPQPVAELATDSVEVNGTATAVAETEALEGTVAEVTVTDETTADVEVAETVEAVATQLDEDAILEALIREEEKTDEATAEQAQEESVSFSVEDLESFTLGDVEAPDDDDEESEDGVLLADMPEMIPVLTPDAGKIRFAEDIIEEGRGAGGRNRRRRSGGANRARGPQRGRR